MSTVYTIKESRGFHHASDKIELKIIFSFQLLDDMNRWLVADHHALVWILVSAVY